MTDTGIDELTLLSEHDLRVAAHRPEEPLFYLEGATEGTTQWKAETLQVVNWGGFEGAVRVPFHPGATLISGASGSGKSTLLDAYIALMMPSDIAFNGASNDAVAGRARSAGQRNLVSYLRGQTDTVPDERGREKPKLLRGEGRPTWGAVGMTFVDDHGKRFTAFRVYSVPARATVFADLVSRFATFEGDLHLAELAPLAAEHFPPKAMKAAFPGLVTHDGYTAFAARLHARLGIGANGDGAKALKLLARIQAGQQIRTVDDLYKEMVLERPATFEAADRAIAHFDDLDAAHRAMQTEQDKADILGPITRKHDELVHARQVVEQIDTFGLTRPSGSPVELWSRRRELALLDAAVQDTQARRRSAAEQVRTATAAVAALESELSAVEAEHRDSGGGAVASLGAQVAEAELAVEERRVRLDDLAARTAALDVTLDDEESYEQARRAAEDVLETYETLARALVDERLALRDREFPLLERRTALTAERRSLDGRPSRIRGRLHEMRRLVAQAAGMGEDELPFLAELVDLRDGEQHWRTAVETVLGASARTLLVPADRLAAFSRAIDPLRLPGRLVFQGVPLGMDAEADPDPDRVAGKLVFKDSPFAGWVMAHVSEASRNALCVEDASDLRGAGFRVTLAGQTRQGTRGTHGRSDGADVIGFSSAEVLAEIDAELDALEQQLHRLDAEGDGIDTRRDALESRRRACEALAASSWEEVDVAGAQARLDDLRRTRDRILTSDDRLTALEKHIADLKGSLESARSERYRVTALHDDLGEHFGRLVEQQDEATAAVERLEEAGVALAPEQSEALDAYFLKAVGPGDPEDLDAFGANLGRLRQTLGEAVATARVAAETAQTDLEAIFASYLRRFPDPNLGRTVASYPDYAAILERIVTTGLAERRQAWQAKLMKWSGEDLVPLAGAMESCVHEIEERLEPINAILEHLPFGATADRLRIRLRRLSPEAVTDFRKALRGLASGGAKDLDDDRLQRRFADLQTFMARIRRREDPRWDPDRSDRDALLDVRRHVYVTAERVGPDGAVLSTHSTLGGKSGGESQELVAFIVGAALRFRLGDELRARPRFAPVFIDEGFIKSDAEFAGRAVQAWKGLGFQLIVGAPPDKVSALEPHMDALLMVTKNTATHFSYVAAVSDAEDFLVRTATAGIAEALGREG